MSSVPDQNPVPEILSRVRELPSVPAVALEIVRLSEDEDCTLEDFVTVLSRDPALSGKMMRVANSSLYCLGTPASNLHRATMVLGMRAVKLMSLTFSLVGSVSSESSGPFDFRGYWRRSILSAVAARMLAERTKSPQRDEAFLCGLLSRIGQLVLARGFPEEYGDVIARAEGGWPTPEHERAVLGCDSSEVGPALLRHWSLPDLIPDAIALGIGAAAAPAEPGEAVESLASILRPAMRLEALVSAGDTPESLPALLTDLEDDLPMDPQDLGEFLGEMAGAVAETAHTLEMEIDPVHTEQIVDTARQIFERESIGIATEVHQTREYAARLERRNRVLADKASRDALTGLPNRSSFDDALADWVATEGRESGALGLLLLDVDSFKSFNDTYGHQTGDEVLKLVADAIRRAAREEELVARYGGEEFAAILPGVSPEGLLAAAERIRKTVADSKLDKAGASLSVTVSVGGACESGIADEGKTARLLHAADRALYEAKHAGRNCTRITDLDAGGGG